MFSQRVKAFGIYAFLHFDHLALLHVGLLMLQHINLVLLVSLNLQGYGLQLSAVVEEVYVSLCI